MVALEVKYHVKCLVVFYNRARKVRNKQQETGKLEDEMDAIVFAELVMYIEEARFEESTAPLFKLADIAQLYSSRLQQLGVKNEKRMHTTRLKLRLLAHFPDMRAQSKGRDVLLLFDEDVGYALSKACEQNSDSDATHLAHAAQIVRRHIFESYNFTGSFEKIVKRSLCHTCCLR